MLTVKLIFFKTGRNVLSNYRTRMVIDISFLDKFGLTLDDLDLLSKANCVVIVFLEPTQVEW